MGLNLLRSDILPENIYLSSPNHGKTTLNISFLSGPASVKGMIKFKGTGKLCYLLEVLCIMILNSAIQSRWSKIKIMESRKVDFFFFTNWTWARNKKSVSIILLHTASAHSLTNYFKTCKMRTSRLENNKVLQKKKERKKEAIQMNSFLIWCGYFGELLHKSSPHSIYGPKMTFERDIFLVFRIRYVFFHRRIYHHGLLRFFLLAFHSFWILFS